MSKLREVLRKYLDEYNLLRVSKNVIQHTEKKKIDVSQVSPDQIGVTSDGTKYYKNFVFDYLQKNGYRMTPEYVEMAAKKFPYHEDDVQEITQVETRFGTFEGVELDDIADDEIPVYALIKIIQLLAEMQRSTYVNHMYEYDVDVISDHHGGGTNIKALEQSLCEHSQAGYRLKQMITNELGQNAVSMSMSKLAVGANSTQDQIVLIYERKAEK